MNKGTATLTNTNVYANQAGDVCSPFELSSSAPLERYVCSWLAVGRRALHLGHGKNCAEQHQNVRESGGQCVLVFLTLDRSIN